MYPEQVPFPVYDKAFWWSDAWDWRTFGREIDFSRPFFEQLLELQQVVPRPCLNVLANENCDFVNQCGMSKDCYLCFNTDYSERCLYSTNTLRSSDCIDCLCIEDYEQCYECVNCNSCHTCFFLNDCANCSDSWFSRYCQGCHHIFGCMNLRNQQYCWFNEQLSREEFDTRLRALELHRRSNLKRNALEVERFWKTQPHPAMVTRRSEECLGDHLDQCKQVLEGFDSVECEECAYVSVLSRARHILDFDFGGYSAELCYDVMGSGDRMYRCMWCCNLWGNTRDLAYVDIGYNSAHCFGCIGIRNAKFAILNRPYPEAEFHALRAKLVAHMTETGEYGEFFPASMSPFPYNESVAQEVYPLEEAQARAMGLRWSPGPPLSHGGLESPDEVLSAGEERIRETFQCRKTRPAYRVPKLEFDFRRRFNLPMSDVHPDVRHLRRRKQKSFQWHQRQCTNCEAPLQTTRSVSDAPLTLCANCYTALFR